MPTRYGSAARKSEKSGLGRISPERSGEATASPKARVTIAGALRSATDAAAPCRMCRLVKGIAAAWPCLCVFRSLPQSLSHQMREKLRRASAQLEGCDAEHPLEPQRRDRAGIHARGLEYRRKPEILRQRDRIAIDARHVEKDRAIARALEQRRQHGLGRSAVVGDERADLAAGAGRADDAPGGEFAVAHKRAPDMAGRVDPRAQECRARRWKYRGVVRHDG